MTAMKRIISHDISNSPPPAHDMEAMAHDIKRWARELGFQQAGISDIDLGQHPTAFSTLVSSWPSRRYGMDG